MSIAEQRAEPVEDGGVEGKVRSVLGGRKTLFLSTSSDDLPWAAGTFFAESDAFTLGIILEMTGRTLANLRANPNVSVVVSSGDAFEPFLQGEGTASVLEGDSDVTATKAALRSKAPEIEPLLMYPVAAVSLRIRRWRVTDVPNGWIPARDLSAPELAAAAG